jgi:hypothetical protein
MLVGIMGFSLSEWIFGFSASRNGGLRFVFPWLMIVLAFPVIRRAVTAGITGSPRNIQLTVITGLRSIIVFDAALCFVTVPQQPGYAVLVLSLLVPSMILSRWLNPT